MKIRVLGTHEIVESYEFASIHGDISHSAEETMKLLTEYRDSNDVGLVFVDNMTFKDAEEQIIGFMDKNQMPLILTVPDREGNIPDNSKFFKLLENLIGLKI